MSLNSREIFSFGSFARSVTVLVAGASRGIGLAFVERLAASPAVRRVWAGCRNPARAAALAALGVKSASLRVLPLDVTDETSLASAAAAVEAEGEPLDLVVNCAGLLHRPDGPTPERRLAEVRADWLMEAFAVNGAGPLLLAKHCELLLPRRARGAICVALHPGTTDTELSRPFQGGVPPEKLFSPALAVERLLGVIDGLAPADSGRLIGWNGERIPW